MKVLILIVAIFVIVMIVSMRKHQKTYLERKWDMLNRGPWFFWFSCAGCHNEITLDPFLLLSMDIFRKYYIRRESFVYVHTCAHCGARIKIVYHPIDPPREPPLSNDISGIAEYVRRRDGGHCEIIDGIIVYYIPFEQGAS